MIKKIFWIFIIALFVAIGMNLSKPTETKTIKIGIVSPLTGNKAQVGEGLRQAIELGRTDFGKVNNTYEFIYEDSAGLSDKSANAVLKLISVDKVNALISITSQDGNIVAKAAQNAGIPHISIANDKRVSEGEYNFIHWTPTYTQAEMFIKELKERGVRKVALFTELNDSSVATVDTFKDMIKNTEIEVVWEERFSGGETDFKSMISKNKDRPAEIIMLQAFSPSIEVLRKQLHEMGITTEVSSITNIGVAKDLKVFEGVWYVSGGQPSKEFNNKFKAKTGYDSTIGAHYGYEVTQMYLSIFESIDNPSPSNIKEAIKHFDFSQIKSVTGATDIDEAGQVISPAALIIIKNGINEAVH